MTFDDSCWTSRGEINERGHFILWLNTVVALYKGELPHSRKRDGACWVGCTRCLLEKMRMRP